MDRYAGKCIGGPYDGKEYVHSTSSFELVEPVIKGAGLLVREPRELAVTSQTLGWYQHGESGYWHWIPR